MEITFTTLAQEQQAPINICGLPCVGNCQTCVQSNADLNAFYGVATAAPAAAAAAAAAEAEEEQTAASAVAAEAEDETLEEARTMDALEEAQRSGEAYDQEEDDDGYRGCQCLDCLNYGDSNYVPYYEDDNDGYGLDWNESGYFD